MNKYMFLAIEEAKKGILNNEGGPFGAVIVKDGVVVGKGHNRVVLNMIAHVMVKWKLLEMLQKI